MKNGDVITGKIVKMSKGKLYLKSKSIGDIKVDKKFIDTFKTDKDIEIHMVSGKKYFERITESGTGRVELVIKGTEKHRIIALNDIKVVGEMPPSINWEVRLNAGISGAKGNSEVFNSSAGSFIQRRSEKSRTTFDSQYIYETNNGDKSKDEWYSDLKYDYFFSKKIYSFSNIRAQQDDIANLDLRLSLSPGLGYQWFESKELNFSTELGIAYLYENFSNGDGENSELTGRLAYYFDKLVFEKISLFNNLQFYPKLSDTTDLYITTSAGIRSHITDTFFTEAKATLEYDTTPAKNAKKTDLYYTIGLGMNF